MYIYINIHKSYTYLHICMSIRIGIYIQTHTDMYSYMYMCIYMCVFAYVYFGLYFVNLSDLSLYLSIDLSKV